MQFGGASERRTAVTIALRTLCTLIALSSLAASAAATEYVVGTGVAWPTGDRAEIVSMAGARHVLTGGLFGEVAMTRLPAARGALVSTLAYSRPRPWLRSGAGVLALHTPDRTAPGRTDGPLTPGFQLACGIQMPMVPGFGVDVDARYVFFDRPKATAAPDRFATRYWTLTLGIAFLGDDPNRR